MDGPVGWWARTGETREPTGEPEPGVSVTTSHKPHLIKNKQQSFSLAFAARGRKYWLIRVGGASRWYTTMVDIVINYECLFVKAIQMYMWLLHLHIT